MSVVNARRHDVLIAALGCILVFTASAALGADPLPSWNEGPSKQSIMSFVAAVTKEGSAEFVPPAERVATFDNDGTLWAEQPMYFQFLFAIDRVKSMAPAHPEWKEKEPYKSLLAGGGVTANSRLRAELAGCAKAYNLKLFLPPPDLCVDNAAMIAGLAYHLHSAGHVSDLSLQATPTTSC